MNRTRTKTKTMCKPKKSKAIVVAPSYQTATEIMDGPDEMPGYTYDDDIQRIQNALADAERDVELDEMYHESNEELLLQVEDMLEELIHTASKSESSTVSHLAFVLAMFFPKLEKTSQNADMALCRKHGVTFEWDRKQTFARVQSDVKERKQAAKRLK